MKRHDPYGDYGPMITQEQRESIEARYTARSNVPGFGFKSADAGQHSEEGRHRPHEPGSGHESGEDAPHSCSSSQAIERFAQPGSDSSNAPQSCSSSQAINRFDQPGYDSDGAAAEHDAGPERQQSSGYGTAQVCLTQNATPSYLDNKPAIALVALPFGMPSTGSSLPTVLQLRHISPFSWNKCH